jgi:hypothetical protein
MDAVFIKETAVVPESATYTMVPVGLTLIPRGELLTGTDPVTA